MHEILANQPWLWNFVDSQKWLLNVLADPPWLLKAYTAVAVVYALYETRLRFLRWESGAAKNGWLALSLFRVAAVALLWVIVGLLLYYSFGNQAIYMQVVGAALTLLLAIGGIRVLRRSQRHVRLSPPTDRLLWPVFAVFSVVVAYTEVWNWVQTWRV